jgi:predicted membrane protein
MCRHADWFKLFDKNLLPLSSWLMLLLWAGCLFHHNTAYDATSTATTTIHKPYTARGFPALLS